LGIEVERIRGFSGLPVAVTEKAIQIARERCRLEVELELGGPGRATSAIVGR
jgi:hypothetical protein